MTTRQMREYLSETVHFLLILEKQILEFTQHYRGPVLWRDMHVDELKRPDSSKHLIREYKDYLPRPSGAGGTVIQLPGDE